MTEAQWERYGDTIDRIKVEGGYIYRVMFQGDVTTSFVPDVDLQRYQSHLRDAYTQGYKDGQEDAKNDILNPEEGLTKYS